MTMTTMSFGFVRKVVNFIGVKLDGARAADAKVEIKIRLSEMSEDRKTDFIRDILRQDRFSSDFEGVTLEGQVRIQLDQKKSVDPVVNQKTTDLTSVLISYK